MKTIASIALEFGGRVALQEQVKRCARVSKHGCGQLLSVDKFQKRERKRKDGTVRMEYPARCKECETKFQCEKGKRRRNREAQAKYAEFKISPAGEYYFCVLKAVPMARELREARRANIGSV